MNLLFVDDRTKRIHWALENLKGYDVTIATCVPEALRQMSSSDWDVVSLDHDLNGHDFQDPDTPTCGMEIVRYIEKTGWPFGKKKPVMRVHSSNIFAAHLMIVRLKALGFEVFKDTIVYEKENMTYDTNGKPL